jgi:membrane-bound serine protease (ClpP class)
LVILFTAAVTFVFFFFFVRKVWEARHRPVSTGSEALLGATGEVREELSPEGLVFVRGALWKAVAPGGPIPVGRAVQVVGRKGLELEVVAGESGAVKETN